MNTEISIQKFQELRNLAVVTDNPLAVEMSQFVYAAASDYTVLKQQFTEAEQRAQRTRDLERVIQNALLLARPVARKGKKPTAKDIQDALKYVREELEKALPPVMETKVQT